MAAVPTVKPRAQTGRDRIIINKPLENTSDDVRNLLDDRSEASTIRVDSASEYMTQDKRRDMPKSQFAPKDLAESPGNEVQPVKDQIDAIIKVQDLLIDADVMNQSKLAGRM